MTAPRLDLRTRFTAWFFRSYRQRLTARGRYLFWTVIALALLGLDTRLTQVYILFGAAVGLFVTAYGFAALGAPRVRLDAVLPERATAGKECPVTALVTRPSGGALSDVQISFPVPVGLDARIAFRPEHAYVVVPPGGAAAEARFTLHPSTRGRYTLAAPFARRTDPLRLAATKETRGPERTLVVYPRFFTIERLDLPAGRRYQPGGVPLAASTGDSQELLGTRDYRDGDPLRSIHWRSFARRGAPVVVEFQEEYFSRVALVMDTYVGRGARASEDAGFEAAISVLASISDALRRSESVVDILAAGPEIYEISAGRQIAQLEAILDVLACLEPCEEEPFARLGPALFERLAQLSSVVVVLLDWDAARERFLREVSAMGAAVRAVVVRDGRPSAPIPGALEGTGRIAHMTIADVEARLAAGVGDLP